MKEDSLDFMLLISSLVLSSTGHPIGLILSLICVIHVVKCMIKKK